VVNSHPRGDAICSLMFRIKILISLKFRVQTQYSTHGNTKNLSNSDCKHSVNMRFEVLMAVKMPVVAFVVKTQCSYVGGYQCFAEC
jgi:hypothetical protein